MSVAVLDIGKTNVKLTVVDTGGGTCHQASRQNAPRTDGPYPHHDVEGIWSWLLDTLADYPDAGDIDAIVTTTHGATAALMAGDRLALPVLDYEHEGIESVSAAYDAERPGFAETASPGLPVGLNLGRQLYWLEHEFPEAFSSVTAILPYPQYWAWRLCGVAASEVTSLGCHTDLWNPAERDYSGLVRARGWDRLFPALRRADELLGPVRPEVARACGVRPDTRVICGVHDSNASYYCHRVRRAPPFTVVSSGTWTICMAAGGDPARLDADADMLANVDVFGDPVPCARFMGGREFAAISGMEEGWPTVDAQAMGRLVASGVMALPSFAPQGGPFRTLAGQAEPAMPTDPAARCALATLYCALVTDYCLDALGAEGDLIVEGSLSRNEVYLGLLAALRPSQPVMPSPDATGTTLGAGRLVHPAPGGGPERAAVATQALAVPELAGYRDRWRRRVRS